MTFLQGTISGIPVWVWILGGGAAIIGIIWWMRRGTSSTGGVLGQNTTATATPDPGTYDPYTGVPLSVEEAINPATQLPAYYGGPGTTNNGLTGPVQSVQQPSGSQQQQQTGQSQQQQQQQPNTLAEMVRQRQTSGQFAYWDTANPQGVPIRPAPGSTTITTYAPYGSPIQLASATPVNAPYGTDTTAIPWLPVQGGGYINAVDVAQQSAPAQGRAAGPYQATPFWPEMTDLSAGRR